MTVFVGVGVGVIVGVAVLVGVKVFVGVGEGDAVLVGEGVWLGGIGVGVLVIWAVSISGEVHWDSRIIAVDARNKVMQRFIKEALA